MQTALVLLLAAAGSPEIPVCEEPAAAQVSFAQVSVSYSAREDQSGCNAHGCWPSGGGCNAHGCWFPGGGCNAHGCWVAGGGCNAHGCHLPGGSCNAHGCSFARPSYCNEYACWFPGMSLVCLPDGSSACRSFKYGKSMSYPLK